MPDPPALELGQLITVGRWECIVAYLNKPEERARRGLGVVVYNLDKPTYNDFDWNGKGFFLPERNHFGGYAGNSPYAEYISRLKRKLS